MTKHARSVATTAWAAAWFSLAAANATSVIPRTFEEMTDRVDLVFVGQVANSRAELRSVGTNRVSFTLVDFGTNRVLERNADTTLKSARSDLRDMLRLSRLV